MLEPTTMATEYGVEVEWNNGGSTISSRGYYVEECDDLNQAREYLAYVLQLATTTRARLVTRRVSPWEPGA